jgi:hydroxyacylglutathione hydrolase
VLQPEGIPETDEGGPGDRHPLAGSLRRAHIPGAYNIWLDGVPAFGGWIANENTRIFLVADGREAMEQAVMSLARIGIDSVEGILASGMESWRDEGLPIESSRRRAPPKRPAGCSRAASTCSTSGRVRMEREAHPGRVHRYVGHLEDNLPLLPKDSEIVVHCNVGHRSGVAASILKRNGFTRIHNMLGGITAWEKLGLPLEKSGEGRREA